MRESTVHRFDIDGLFQHGPGFSPGFPDLKSVAPRHLALIAINNIPGERAGWKTQSAQSFVSIPTLISGFP
jgi:hypothetical protein